jgi:hypothetical protein
MMDLLLYAAAGVGLLVALLAARGAWLIGQGSEAEMQAREMSGTSTTATTGWSLLDGLQSGNIPVISTIEQWLGWADEDEAQDVPQAALKPCEDCGSRAGLRSGVDTCPECGGNCLRTGVE